MKAASLGSLHLSWSATLRHCALAASALPSSESGGHEGRDDAPAALAGMGEGVAHGVNPAALPGGVDQLGDRRLDALVGIGDDQLDAAQAPPSQLAQELGPEGLGLRGADVHAEHLAPPVRVHADGDDHGDRDDAMVAAHFDVGRVEPDYGQSPSSGRSRKAFTRSSISSHSRDNWLLETPAPPIARTRSSTERVDTPCT